MTEPKKRITTKQRLARAAYYIQNRTESCPHCEDLPMLIESHDMLALKNRRLKREVKELTLKLEKYEQEEAMRQHNEWLALQSA